MEVSNQPTIEQLQKLVDPKNPELLKQFGGVHNLAVLLNSSTENGLKNDDNTIAKQKELYGDNSLPEPVLHSFLEFVWEALQDQTLLVLIFAAALEVSIGIYKSWFATQKDGLALIDGGAIIVAILIVVLIGSISDYRKQGQFRALNDFGKSLSVVKIIRSSETIQVAMDQIVVGDIVVIETGVVIPADGILVGGFNVEIDESTMTGEPHAIKKDELNDPFLLSGTNVNNGVGKMLVIGTGINSMNGKSLQALDIEPEDTPLQQKLGALADFIAKGAFYLAIAMIVILLIIYFVTNRGISDSLKISEDILMLLILAVTVVVVAVPEGLPLAVTLSLAHATLQMLKDNNLVRHLASCETMGNATTICSDKTGTLTLNKMTVVEGVLIETCFEQDTNGGLKDLLIKENPDAMNNVLSLVAKSLNVNSTAGLTINHEGKAVIEGSKTEIAILDFMAKLGYPYDIDRKSTKVTTIVPFSSLRKRMSCVVSLDRDAQLETIFGVTEQPRMEFIFVKGASEIVFENCNRILTKTGKVELITEEKKQLYRHKISEFAGKALRTICAAIKPITNEKTGFYQDGTIADDTELVMVALFGILDPLRPEVPGAVAKCQAAGITVRMVTGDSIDTAKAIARGCGILTADGLVMEGPAFRVLTQEEMDTTLPKLQVLARSSPLDKQILVNNLKRLGETVAVTGDGTNDAPALSSAHVGFSMGIAGTEVAKEASDIILMDDNFASLVRAVVWGRCVYDAIRKFLQFQLTVNISAVVITVVTSIYTTVTGPKSPKSILTAVQLLWVNLIMDTLAALALATDNPTDALLNRTPSKRTEPIVNADMFRQIIAQAIYQIAVCLLLYFKGGDWFEITQTDFSVSTDVPYPGYKTASLVFNVFIFCQIFNEINCRSITTVEFGGIVFQIDSNGLNGVGWAISFGLGFGSIVVGYLVRVLPPFPVPGFLIVEGEDIPAKRDYQQLEIRVIEKTPSRLSLHQPTGGWKKLRLYVTTANKFKTTSTRKDLGSQQMMNTTLVRKAIADARSRGSFNNLNE
ncbi:Calcium-transporting ATPase 10, plasma membrane-type [Boothiomyces macroporosus]|uniref:Calcium-transporting ATPase n=1 Tax=Boothiomyces macroporosus TaxID=261099 RepID=A0AAD5UKK3_9FUNG|nr:Calcium-transporting ATPase 10, plasma membrane-type [Boothiomyces macroporosus]